MGARWQQVWSKPTPYDPAAADHDPTLADLIVADGFNTGHGDIATADWIDFVDRTCERFALEPGDSLFDVGCGAGAFLHPARARGIRVGGIDYSATRIELAHRAMPDAGVTVGEAVELPTTPPADVVLSFGVFLYFPSLDYAHDVIERMCRKAGRAVGIFEVPDVEMAEAAMAERQAAAGGADAYARRYQGLEHLAYSRSWLTAAMEEHGLRDVTTEPQAIRGYGNGRFRFNAWGWIDGAP